MHLIRNFSNYVNPQGSVLALGNFDGVHLGHQAIIKTAVEQAKKMGASAGVVTFEPHPRRFFAPHVPHLRLMRFADKWQQMSAFGVENIFLLRFNTRLASMSAEDFLHDILLEKLRAKHIVVGHDFCFGKGRQGNRMFLENAAQARGFGFSALEAVRLNGGVVSSSAIRANLTEGNVEKAGQMLGRPYAICGHVVHGQARGRALGFPTANISLASLCAPKYGVYAARVWLAGVAHEAVVNVGVKPTFGNNTPTLEAHLFTFNQSIYGQRIRVDLIRFIREEKRFVDVSSLKAQIENDMKNAKEILAI